jgi:aspartate oxidase
LSAAEDGHYDFVFSFDSLVHAELDVLENYIPEILKKLTQHGVAFIHHSNLGALCPLEGEHEHSRARSVSGELVAELITKSDGAVLVQETIDWVDTTLIDCLTTFGRSDSFGDKPGIFMQNASFMAEADLIAKYQSPYSTRKPRK